MSKDIWHTADEKPVKGCGMVAYYSSEYDEELLVGYYNTEYEDFRPLDETYGEEKTVKKWCYLTELIALETELERTRKALKTAVDGLEKMTWGCDGSDAEHLLKEIKEITAQEQKE